MLVHKFDYSTFIKGAKG